MGRNLNTEDFKLFWKFVTVSSMKSMNRAGKFSKVSSRMGLLGGVSKYILLDFSLLPVKIILAVLMFW